MILLKKKVIDNQSILVLKVVKNLKNVSTSKVEVNLGHITWGSSCSLSTNYFNVGDRYVLSAVKGFFKYNIENTKILETSLNMCNFSELINKTKSLEEYYYKPDLSKRIELDDSNEELF